MVFLCTGPGNDHVMTIATAPKTPRPTRSSPPDFLSAGGNVVCCFMISVLDGFVHKGWMFQPWKNQRVLPDFSYGFPGISHEGRGGENTRDQLGMVDLLGFQRHKGSKYIVIFCGSLNCKRPILDTPQKSQKRLFGLTVTIYNKKVCPMHSRFTHAVYIPPKWIRMAKLSNCDYCWLGFIVLKLYSFDFFCVYLQCS